VAAPIDAVWAQISTLERVLAHVSEASDVVLEADGRVRFRARLRWGPFGYALAGVGVITEMRAPAELRCELRMPAAGATVVDRFELTEVSGSETSLRVVVDAQLGQLARRISGVAVDAVEVHARRLAANAAGRAERHWQAEQRLRNRKAEP